MTSTRESPGRRASPPTDTPLNADGQRCALPVVLAAVLFPRLPAAAASSGPSLGCPGDYRREKLVLKILPGHCLASDGLDVFSSALVMMMLIKRFSNKDLCRQVPIWFHSGGFLLSFFPAFLFPVKQTLGLVVPCKCDAR